MLPDKLLSEYKKFKTAFEAGDISEADFVASCQALMAEDDAGDWWTIDATGQGLFYNTAQEVWEPRPLPGGRRKKKTRRKAKTKSSSAATSGARAKVQAGSKASAISSERRGAAAMGATVMAANRGALVSLGVVFGVSLILSWLGWDVLKVVPEMINSLIPTGSCTGFSPGSVGMYFCSGFVALRVVFGSLVLAVVLLFFRKPIAAVISRVNVFVPVSYRSVMPAILASVFFAIIWSGSHTSTGHLWGVLPHRAFPAVVGVMVHLTVFYGPGFMEHFSGFFDMRDRLSKLTRWVLVFLTPMGVSLIITYQERVSNEAFKQQFVVIVGMLAAFIIMTPRSGNISDLRNEVGKSGDGD